MNTLTTKEIEEVHDILRSDGFPCTETGAERWLLKRGYTQEQVRGKTWQELYFSVWACINVPF